MVRLRKSGRTEVRLVERPQSSASGDAGLSGTEQLNPEESVLEEVEGDLWEDMDGNVHAWTPKGSDVISIEVRDAGEETVESLYKHLKGQPQGGTVDEELAELKEAFVKVCRRLAELEQR